MATFKPSKYQQAVYDYIQNGSGNAVIDAVAGSGKSTTIVNALKLVPTSQSVLFLAFNKAIVEELKIKVGNLKNVEIKTLHSLGASATMKTFKCGLNDDKYRSWVNNGVKYGSLTPTYRLSDEEFSDWKSNIRHLIDLGRVNLSTNGPALIDLAYKHNILVLDNEIDIALKGIQWGEYQTSTIDFTDMIYFPNVKNIKMPQYDWVFIDECQDLNAAQRNMFLKCLSPNGRFIAVGDPRQAIYGFAGADVESFELLKNTPNTVLLPLSVCYRCSSEIINSAKELVPQIEARDNAPMGEINRSSSINDVVDGDMILCRVSAPLAKLCMNYIANGIKAYVKGRDIGANLINMIKKTNKIEIDEAMKSFKSELSRIEKKVASKQGSNAQEARDSDIYKTYEDKVKAIDILSEGLEKSDDVIKRIDTIFSDNQKSGICLSTIHKSKGLENNRVFILCEDKLYLKHCMKIEWMAEQEKNLVYVAITRAKNFLGYIKDFEC